MTTAILTRPTDLDRAIADLSDFARTLEPGRFEEGVLCSLTILTRVRDDSPALPSAEGLDYAMIRMAGFAPE
jgi:hypothetical protein